MKAPVEEIRHISCNDIKSNFIVQTETAHIQYNYCI